jgi:hypothetical protein
MNLLVVPTVSLRRSRVPFKRTDAFGRNLWWVGSSINMLGFSLRQCCRHGCPSGSTPHYPSGKIVREATFPSKPVALIAGLSRCPTPDGNPARASDLELGEYAEATGDYPPDLRTGRYLVQELPEAPTVRGQASRRLVGDEL